MKSKRMIFVTQRDLIRAPEVNIIGNGSFTLELETAKQRYVFQLDKETRAILASILGIEQPWEKI